MADEIQRQALARDIARRLPLASVDEIRVVDRVLGRLELGRERYGMLDLGADRRDWRRERFEERLDALVYDVCDELVLEDAARAGLREAARREMLGDAVPIDLAAIAAIRANATPAGRLDAILEAAQTGAITADFARELIEGRELLAEFSIDRHATKIGGPDPYESVEVEIEDLGGEGG